jgi:acetyltransferase-like isoleucine patch superfamily enzyme/acyl carrier protein
MEAMRVSHRARPPGGVPNWRRFVERKRASLWLRKCESVGDGVRLVGHPAIVCAANSSITIGARFWFSSEPVESHMVAGRGAEIRIGDDVWIGHGAAIAADRRISIGDGARLGPFVTIMDNDFHVVGDRAAVSEVTPIAIGRSVHIGSGVTILRGATIGDGARVESGSVVSGIVAANATVAGVPAAIRRAGSGNDADGADISSVIMRSLGLSAPPDLHAGPRDVPGWDSLGALKLLLALEEAFDVRLEAEDLVRAHSVGAVVSVVERAIAATDAAARAA